MENIGYIIVKEGNPQTGVVALSGTSSEKGPRWIPTLRPLNTCFVRSEASIRRALYRKRTWTQEATHAYHATYNPATGFANPKGAAIPFAEVREEIKGTKRLLPTS